MAEVKREGRHDGSRNKAYDYSSSAGGKAFGKVVWGKCNVCSYPFAVLPSGDIDMEDFRRHKDSHTLGEIRKAKYSQRA